MKTTINEVEIIQNSIKELNEYVEMLITGDHSKDYIVGKVEHWADVIKNDAKHVFEYVKQQKEQNETI